MEKKYKELIRLNICILLKDKGLTAYEAAILIGENPGNFKKYYDGKKPYPLSVLYKCTIAFNMSLLDLLTYPDKWIPITAVGDVDYIQISLQGKDPEKIKRLLEEIYKENNDLLTP